MPDGFARTPSMTWRRSRLCLKRRGCHLRRHGGVRAGRERRASLHGRIPADGPSPHRGARRAAHVRRDPMRHVPLRHPPLRLPAFRHHAGRRHHRQGHRLGIPHGHVRCARRSGGLVHTGRPRLHVRRQLSGRRRRSCHRRELSEGGIAEQVEQVGAYMRERMYALPHVEQVRGLGLMIAVDLDADASARTSCSRASMRGCSSTSSPARARCASSAAHLHARGRRCADREAGRDSFHPLSYVAGPLPHGALRVEGPSRKGAGFLGSCPLACGKGNEAFAQGSGAFSVFAVFRARKTRDRGACAEVSVMKSRKNCHIVPK